MSHITIENPEECCGCGSCASTCPVHCIALRFDKEGFPFPIVDNSTCIECGKCVEVCPILHQYELGDRISPLQVFAAWNLNAKTRQVSSSGGVFSVFAEKIIALGGIIVGAAFNNHLKVCHIIVDNISDLSRLRGSKYVQSDIPIDLFSHIRTALQQERHVLFTGTPCQVCGLRNYLQRDYSTLYCCDFVCHGVPSPGWFNSHISTLSSKSPLLSFDFRNKRKGWKNFCIKKTWAGGNEVYETLFTDPYMASFLRNYSLRESCFSCKFSTTTRQGDITLGDYWYVDKKYPAYDKDNKGTSLVLINNKKGVVLLNKCKVGLFLGIGDIDSAKVGNPQLYRASSRPIERSTFFVDQRTISVDILRNKYHLHPLKYPYIQIIYSYIQRILARIVKHK